MNMGKNGKIIVLVAEGCPACSQLGEKIGGDNRFELMDVTTNPEAKRLAHELGVTAVPSFLYSNKRGELCVLDDKGKAGKCVRETYKHGEK
jgi:hypothetical protein